MALLKSRSTACLLLVLGGVLGCGDAVSQEAPPPASPGGAASVDTLAMQLGKLAETATSPVVSGRDGWLFFVPELRHLAAGRFWGEDAARASRAPDPASADPLPAILDFKAQLDQAGIELLFVPVPAKAVIYPQKLPGVTTVPAERLDRFDHAFLELLRDHGVAVVDLVPAFREHAEDGDGRLYCRQDTHWSGRGCKLAAEHVAAQVRDRPWLQDVPRTDLESETRTISLTGDLWRELPEPRPAPEELPIELVGRRTTGGLEPLPPSPESPVLVLGDSHTLVFHAGGDLHARGAGFADHLARELGFAVDLVGVRGSGATPARVNLLRRGNGLAGKKLVIWCLSVREYTEGQGWKKVPIVRPSGGG